MRHKAERAAVYPAEASAGLPIPGGMPGIRGLRSAAADKAEQKRDRHPDGGQDSLIKRGKGMAAGPCLLLEQGCF